MKVREKTLILTEKLSPLCELDFKFFVKINLSIGRFICLYCIYLFFYYV